MRRLTSKIIGIIVLTMLLINSNLMLIISTALDTIENQENNEITQEPNATASLELEKYCNYSLSNEEEKGVLVQVNLKTGIDFPKSEEYKPLKSTEVTLSSPKIEENYPQKVIVLGKSTKATNGKESEIEPNYQYNQENGELTIYTTNEADENGNIYNNNDENACDEYKIIYYYDENSYNNENIERNIEINANVKETLYDDNNIEVETQCNLQQNVTENIGGLVSTRIQTSDIYNGYIYSNAQNGTNEQTTYLENTEIDISYEKVADETIIATEDNFIDSSENIINTDEIVYKTTRFSKLEVLDILGENGKIEILNENDEIVAEIDRDSPVSESGIIEVDYGEGITELRIKITKPLKIGSIHLQNKKAIKETMLNDSYKKIQTNQNIVLRNTINKDNEAEQEAEATSGVKEQETQEIDKVYISNIAEIKNAETNIDVKIDKTELTNKIQNEVNITATLKTNSMKYNLFKNPTILLTFPNEVEEVILGDVSLLYDNNLSIKSAEVVDNNGAKAIKVELNGAQNSYNQDSMIEGANVIIPATVILNKEFESTKGNISVIYTNETATSIDYSNEGKDSKQIEVSMESIISKPQVETSEIDPIMQVVPYSQNEDMNNNAGIATIAETGDTISEAGSTVEETGLKVETVAKVGDKVLSEGDSVHEDEIIQYIVKITNTTDTDIKNIKFEGSIPDGTTYAEIEYNLDDSGENIYVYVKDEKVKTYSENIESIEPQKSIIKFYEVQVNKLAEGEETKGIEQSFKIYKDNKEIKSTVLKNSIKNGDITVRLQSGRNNATEYIYGLWIYNNTSNNIENVKATCEIPYELNITNIEAFEIVKNGENESQAEPITIEQNLEDKTLNMKIPKISANSKAKIIIYVAQEKFESGKYSYNVNMSTKVSYNNSDEIYYSNDNRMQLLTEGVQVIQTSKQEGKELKQGDEIEYDVLIKNVGTTYSIGTSINIQDYLPEELIPDRIEYESFAIDDETGNFKVDETTGEYIKTIETEDISDILLEEDGSRQANCNIICTIPNNEQMILKIYATADFVIERTEIENMVTVTGDYIQTTESNTIKSIIVLEDEEDEEDNDNNENNGDSGNNDDNNINEEQNKQEKYKISGLAWLDSNKNGEREEEQLLSNIKVQLYNANTNSLVKQTATNDNGLYEFTELEKGNYLVLFEYDTNTYTITSYKKNNIDETINNDVVEKEARIDGKTKIVGLTDIINLNNNKENIDIGLIKNSVFDLSLEKYLTKVTVSNKSGTKEYNCKNGKLQKVEIHSKYLNSSTLTIEYKIVVKNEGEVEAYVSEIVDYLPDGLTFDSSQNSNWAKSGNNILINNGLAHTKLLAGESKEISLILTKNMTEDGTGTITNGAEIKKATSTNDTKDIDSQENNKNKEEDDYSEAQLIVSVSTGIVKYTLMIIFFIFVLILGSILIKKKKINLKHIIPLMAIILSLAIINVSSIDSIAASMTKDKIKSLINNDPKLLNKVVKNDSFGTSVQTVNSGSSNFATNESPLSAYLNKNVLHCTNKGRSMCGVGIHRYKRYSWEVTNVITKNKKSEKTKKPELKDKTDASGLKVKDEGNYTLIGPYKIKEIEDFSNLKITVTYKTTSGKMKKSETVHLFDNGGGEKDNAIKNGNQFWIKIKESKKDIKNIKNVKLEINGLAMTTYYSVKVRVTEHWRCIYVSPGDHNGHDCSTSQCQPLERVYDRETEIDGSDPYSDNISLPIPDIDEESYKLKIIKKDAETKDALSGAIFKVEGPNGYSKNNLKTNQKGVIELKLEEKGEYTVTEMQAPSGYKMATPSSQTVQVVDKKATVEVTFENEPTDTPPGPSNIEVYKTDVDTGEPIQGVTFELYRYTPKIGVTTYADGSKSTYWVNNEYESTPTTFTGVTGSDGKASWTMDVNYNSVVYWDTQEIGWRDDYTKPIYEKDEETKKDKLVGYEQESYTYTVTHSDSKYYPYKYMIKEVECPEPYDINDQIASGYTMQTEEFTLEDGNVTKSFEFKNILLGDIQIEKIDSYEGGMVNGAVFKIWYDEGGARQYISSYSPSSAGPSAVGYTTDANSAKLFVTGQDGNSDGYINLINLPCYRKYYAQEVGLQDKEDEDFFMLDLGVHELDLSDPLSNLAKVSVTVDNQSIYTKISGKVWEDDITGKVSKRNDLYDNNERLISGIEVRVVYKGTDKTVVNGNGQELKTYTDSKGSYEFKKVLKDNLSNYSVKFKYNGLKYENVQPLQGAEEVSSKAIDVNRDVLGEKYSTIENGTAKDLDGNKTYNLSYQHGNHSSELVGEGAYEDSGPTGLGYTDDTQGKIVNATDSEDNGIRIYAETEEVIDLKDYLKVPAGKKYPEVRNMNLGIYLREQPDLALIKDIQNVRIAINGYEHTYEYAQRFKNQSKYGDGFNVGVKFGNEYGKMKYTRAIYKSDYTWKKPNDSRELQVYITYKIQIKNEATGLITKVNNIVDYYDANYTLVGAGTQLDEKGNINSNNQLQCTESDYNADYRKVIVNTESRLEAQEAQDLYLQFKLDREKVVNLINGGESLDNVVEINSYSTYDSNGDIYAGIDRDSEPGTAIPGNEDTYEDDTDKAPALQLEVADNARIIKGTVFLDQTEDGLKSVQIREGDGKYTDGEKTIDGVKIKLVEKSGTGLAYYIGEGNTVDSANSVTSGGGNFSIQGFIPGDYELVYTWGEQNGGYDVQNYKGTVYKQDRYKEGNGKWYRGDGVQNNNVDTRYTDAIDDYAKRQEIDEELKIKTNSSDSTKITPNRTMDSITPKMKIGVEYEDAYTASSGDQYTYEIRNIDFGIVKRAIQSIQLTKRISAMKVTLGNGQVISDVTIDEAGNMSGEKSYLTYMGPANGNSGFIKAELDNELIQGAKLEVTYEFKFENQSEVDLVNENYYKFGSEAMSRSKSNSTNFELKAGNETKGWVNKSEVVWARANNVIDYLDRDWGYEEDKNTNWKAITKEELEQNYKNTLVNESVFGDTSSINNKIILLTEALKNQQCCPGENSKVNLQVSKALSATDEISLENETEIIEVEKDGGSKIVQIPGSFVPGTTPQEPDEDWAETVIVTPSTGKNLNFILPISIGISALVILGTGIIVIKKKVI